MRKGIALGETFATMVREDGRDLFEVVAGPAFALTVLKVRGRTREESDKWTKELYERINAAGEIYLTSTVLDGDFCIRVVTSMPFVGEENVRTAFKILVQTAEEVMKLE